jgi:hypothetical protein
MDNVKRQLKLKEQIELRIKLLKKKVSGEIDDIVIPTSLTKLRLWKNKEYGVKTIGSPSSFVTTHSEHGRKVLLLQKLLGQLKTPKKTKAKPASQKLREVTQENTRLNSLLQSTANQYVQYSQELKRLRESAVLNKAIENGLREELKEVKAELANARTEVASIRKKLLRNEATQSSKVTKVDFGKVD